MSLYESHVTVEGSQGQWCVLCRNLGIKPLLIELATGEHRRQLMCAAVFDGTLEAACAYTTGIQEQARAVGLEIVRMKLETPLDKASEYAAYAYYEAHVKMLIEPRDETKLRAVSERSGWPLSRNIFQTDVDGYSKWYLTRRIYGSRSPREAAGELSRAHERLLVLQRIAGLPPCRCEFEAVITDTNPRLDAGWA